MAHRPFELIAACTLPGFPTTRDVETLTARLQEARRRVPHVVGAAPRPPAIFRGQRYVLETQFIVWAEQSGDATQAVEGLLDAARVPHAGVHPTGRALAAGDVPPPPRARPGADRGGKPRKRAAAGRGRPARGAPARRRKSR